MSHIFKKSFREISRKKANAHSNNTMRAKKYIKTLEKKDGAKETNKK